MRQIEIKVNVDLSSAAERDALSAFMAVLGGSTFTPTLEREPKETEEPKKPTKTKKTEDPKADLAKTTEPPKEDVAGQKTEKKQEEPIKQEKPEENTVTLLDLRKLVSDRAANHRDAMKAKLSELGAVNVSSLDESKYAAFETFLLTLK